MPNNGIISKQAVIPGSFIVESAESTDLVIINTPLTGSRVEQKAVPVSALGGGGSLPFNSYVYAFKLSGTTSESYEVYNDVPVVYGSWGANIFPGANTNDPVNVTIEFMANGESSPVDLQAAFLSIDSSIIAQSSVIDKQKYIISFTITDATFLQSAALVELRMYNLNA
jgi:hypothetical protein